MQYTIKSTCGSLSITDSCTMAAWIAGKYESMGYNATIEEIK